MAEEFNSRISMIALLHLPSLDIYLLWDQLNSETLVFNFQLGKRDIIVPPFSLIFFCKIFILHFWFRCIPISPKGLRIQDPILSEERGLE
jgi:hypothetical protein